MSRKRRKRVLYGGFLAVVACATSAVMLTRASVESPLSNSQTPTPRVVNGSGSRYRQPEALRVARRMGSRFGPSSRTTSVMNGRLTIDAIEQPVTITRRQTDTGENIQLLLADRVLTWTAEEGIKSLSSTPTNTEKLLFERLIYDSPDYFVLAQLRGASYFTVARNARPTSATEDYDGPIWTVVRIDDPETDEALRPKSPWRLYHVNSLTGLIDRVVSRLGDETVEARVVSWAEQAGEKAPSQITWSIGNRVVMSYQVSSFSHLR